MLQQEELPPRLLRHMLLPPALMLLLLLPACVVCSCTQCCRDAVGGRAEVRTCRQRYMAFRGRSQDEDRGVVWCRVCCAVL